LGNMTRLAQFYLKSEKSYEGVIRFGFATDTYDAEGEPTGAPRELAHSLDQLREMTLKFCGVIEQVPPPFSAKKIQGVPAYKLARNKKDVVLKPVQVEIKEFEKNLLRRTPMRRFGQPRDLDGVSLLLASDAGRYIAGASIPVDGGQALAWM